MSESLVENGRTIDKKNLIKLSLNNDPYSYDVNRIIIVCANAGFEIDYDTAKQAWESYSKNMSAGWMSLPNDESVLFNSVMCYAKEDKT